MLKLTLLCIFSKAPQSIYSAIFFFFFTIISKSECFEMDTIMLCFKMSLKFFISTLSQQQRNDEGNYLTFLYDAQFDFDPFNGK